MYLLLGMGAISKELAARGVISRIAYKIAAVSTREGDYWTRTGLIAASVEAAAGKGSSRAYSVRDVVSMRAIKAMREAGLSLQRVRRALKEIRARWPEIEAPLSSLTLVTDGADVLTVLPEPEAGELLMSLVRAPGQLAARALLIRVSAIAAEVRAAVERERQAAVEQPRKRAAGWRR